MFLVLSHHLPLHFRGCLARGQITAPSGFLRVWAGAGAGVAGKGDPPRIAFTPARNATGAWEVMGQPPAWLWL